jgi:transmembrane sensor
MEPSNQIKELIVRSLINDLSEEEDSLVVEWINASEDNRHYFIQVRDTWQLTAVKGTAQVNESAEWDLFRENIAARDANVVSINEQVGQGKAVIYRRLLRVAAAAAVVLLVGLGWAYFFKGDRQGLVSNTAQKRVTLPTVIQHEVNTTGKEKSITLADGSMIVLFNNSEIAFEKPFTRRNIKLTGKALFNVAKDAARPFTVESGAITTTALGTEFTVTAFAGQKQLSVRLYNGKVVIKPVAPLNRLMTQAIYLLPGQEFVYGPDGSLVRTFSNQHQRENKDPIAAADNPTLPVNTKGSWHMYNNQPLAQVFDHLSGIYEVMIVYEYKDVHQKYFVGQFRTTDSVELILNLITKANKLKYTREDNTYIIHQ